MGIYGRMTHWIHDFLNDRKIQVRINNNLSKERIQENGVPQGSVISPLLFNIAVNDLSCHLPNVHISHMPTILLSGKAIEKFLSLKRKFNTVLTKSAPGVKNGASSYPHPKPSRCFSQTKSRPKFLLPSKITQSRFSNPHNFWEWSLTASSRGNNTSIILLQSARENLTSFDASAVPLGGLIARPYFKSTQPSSDQLLNMEVKLLTLHLLQWNRSLIASNTKPSRFVLELSKVYHSLNFALNVEIPLLNCVANFLVNMYCTKIKSHQNHPNHNLDQDNWQKQYFAEKWGQTSHKTPFEGRTSPISLPVFPLNNPFPY